MRNIEKYMEIKQRILGIFYIAKIIDCNVH